MDKKILILSVGLILIMVGLSGCNELDSVNHKQSGNTDKVKIVDYNIETYSYENFIDRFNYDTHTKVTDGLSYDKIGEFGYYNVNGTIKNIAGKKLNRILIIVTFCDKNGNFINSRNATVNNLPNNYTDNFEVKIFSDSKYFENIDNIKFEIEVS